MSENRQDALRQKIQNEAKWKGCECEWRVEDVWTSEGAEEENRIGWEERRGEERRMGK